MKDIAQAAKDAAKATREIRNSLISSYRETLIDIGESLVFFTPLKTGLASSNWNVGLRRTSNEREPLSGEKGVAAVNAMKLQVLSLEPKNVSIFNNPIEYIDDLEGGTSPQARSGMVEPTMYRIGDIWQSNLLKNKII